MKNKTKCHIRTFGAFTLVLLMTFTNLPLGFFDYAFEKWKDRNVVDSLWLTEHDDSVDNFLRTKVAYAGEGNAPSVYQGSFQAQGSTGTQTISGVGFTPSAVIFYWTEQTAEGTDTGGDNMSVGIGFATGSSNERGVSTWSTTANTSATGQYNSATNMILVQNGQNGTLLNAARLDSFNSDGFVVDWTTANASTHIIHYLAFNSSVVTSAITETFSFTTGTGNLSVSNAGFQPDFVMFISTATSTSETTGREAQIMVGAATSASEEWVTSFRSEDLQGTSDTCIQDSTTSSVAFIENDGNLVNATDCDQIDARADFTQFTANGFDINKSDAPAVEHNVFYLALAGPQFTVGSLNSPTSTGNQSVSSLSYQPDGVFFAGAGVAALSDTVTANLLGGFSLGSAASTSASTAQGAVSITDVDADTSPDPDPRTVTTAVYTEIETATPNQEAEADLVSMNSNGFTLNWTNVDETGNEVLWWTIEEGPATNPPTATTNFATPGFNSAMLHGTKTGGDNATEHGFAYSTDSALSTGVSTTTLGALNGNHAFSSFITGLSSNQTYFFRAYATNGGGTGYGSIKSFVTGNSTATRNMRLFGKLRLTEGSKAKLHQQ